MKGQTVNKSNNDEIIINTFVNGSGLAFFLLLALLVLAGGCATTGRDTLEGWKDLGSAYVLKGCPFGQTIKDDYQSFNQRLSPYERRSVDDIWIEFYEGTDRRRAVKITTLGKGIIGEIWWNHILIYDSDNKRIKMIRYKSGRSLS
jgi:hypothetical protein